MSSPETLCEVLRNELRRIGMTYKQLAELIEMSESSVKRMFAQKDMSLTRLADICKVAKIPFEDILRLSIEQEPTTNQLTINQEKALMADPKLLLVAISCLGNWTFEQIVETYTLTEAECVLAMIELDKLGLIELKPMNRYRLRVSAAFQWRPEGPVHAFIRDVVVPDYFAGQFSNEHELLMCVPARLAKNSLTEIKQKAQQLAIDIARLQKEDKKVPVTDREGYTLMIGFRSWELSSFTALRRPNVMDAAKKSVTHHIGPKNK